MRQNAYFQLNTKGDGMYLKVFPPVDGGEKLTLDEVETRIKRLKITPYDSTALIAALGSQEKITEYKFSDMIAGPFEGDLSVKMSEDKMFATAKFYCESERCREFTRESVIRLLIGAGVKHGVDEDLLSEWLLHKRFNEDILIAEGTPVDPSRDAVIENKFKSVYEFIPVIDDFGNIDFRQLNTINNVQEHDVLSILTPAYDGKHGMTVAGKSIPPKKPLRLNLKGGKNTHLSEDSLTLTAACAGHVGMEGDKVVVYNVYTVGGNLGTATGNIKYDGTVKVKGDVLAGYSVDATGDIFIDGVVEGASLVAGGNIVVARGIHGQRKGHVKAGGNVIAKFIQEADVTAGGSVTSDSILHSFVSAKENIDVITKKGLINGGEMRAGRKISVNIVGSASSGTNTQLEVGADIDKMKEFNGLEKQLLAKRAEQRRLRFTTGSARVKLDAEISEMLKRYLELKAEIEGSTSGRVVVMGIIYEGARIVISNVSYYVRSDESHCQFQKEDMDIKIYPC